MAVLHSKKLQDAYSSCLLFSTWMIFINILIYIYIFIYINIYKFWSPDPEWHLFHRYSATENCSGWKGPLEISYSNPTTPSGVKQGRAARTSFRWVLSTSKDVGCTAPLCNLFQCFTTLKIEKIFFFWKWNFILYLCSLPLVLSLDSTEISLAPSSLLPFIKVFIRIGKIPLSLLFSRLNSLSSTGFSFYGICSNPKSSL